MKNLTLSFLFIFLSFTAFAQLTFDWEEQLISEDNNMKEMTVMDDNTAVLVGYGRTFVTSSDLGDTWDAVPILTPLFDFLDISINSAGVGYAISASAKVVDNPSGGEDDVYADGVLLKTTDNGVTWSVYDISTIGSGDDYLLSPNATGCFSMRFRAVEVLEDGTVFLGITWYHYDPAVYDYDDYSSTFKSTDGISWEPVESDGYYPACIESGTASIYYGGYKHLFKAEAGSETITDLYPALVLANAGDDNIYIGDVEVVSEDEVYFISTSDGIFLTEDQGTSFTKMGGTDVPSGGNDFLAVNDTVFLVLGTSTKSKVTRDGGQSWEDCYPGETCYEIGGIFGDSVVGLGKTYTYAIATADLIAGGPYTWNTTEITFDENLQKMHVIDSSNAIIVGYGQTLVSSADAGASWTAMETPDLFVFGATYDFESVTSVGTVSYATTRRWTKVDFPSDAGVSDVYAHGLIYYSADSWNTWELLDYTNIGTGTDPALSPNADKCYGMSPTEIACVNDTTVYVYVTWIDSTAGYVDRINHSNVFKTEDGGESWAPLFEDLGNSYMNHINFLDEDNGFIVGNSFFRKTTDGGASFTDMYEALWKTASPDDSTIFIYEMDYVDENTWYITSSTNGVFVTNDGGVNYAKLGTLAGASALEVLNDSTLIVLGSSSKSKISWDKGTTWTDCYPGSTIYESGGILGEQLVALAKSNIYKIPLADLEAPSSEADILSFVLAEQTGDAVIDTDNNTVMIEVSTGTDLSALTPTITVSEGASISPESEVEQDFSAAVSYTVTAEDLSTTKDWTVTVTVAVGIDQLSVENIMLYPNPAHDRLFLENLDKVESISIHSVSGSSVMSMETPKLSTEIDISTFKNGVYFISFKDASGSVSTRKFVKM